MNPVGQSSVQNLLASRQGHRNDCGDSKRWEHPPETSAVDGRAQPTHVGAGARCSHVIPSGEVVLGSPGLPSSYC